LELPVANEEGQEYLTLENFAAIIKKGKLPIKQLLMDQKRVAGIGNIYANDALWLAEIDPGRTASDLSTDEVATLYESVVSVLKEGLKYQGASETNFFHVDGGRGAYQNHFLVYGRTGLPCKRCSTPIERIVLGGRGTFICTSCQKVA
jgi:formamidopyrimidine-DNA glycosylase